MADSEPFTLISSFASTSLYPDYEALTSAKIADQDVQITAALRSHYPELTITVIPFSNCPLVTFANLGYAIADLDTTDENIIRWRGYIPSDHRGGKGQLGDAVFFAKYHYKWGDEDFLLYTIGNGYTTLQYVLKEPGPGEDVKSHCRITDTLIKTVVTTIIGDETEFVYVFDRYWYRSKPLWDEVQQASWDKVILDENMKKELTGVAANFFDSRDVYKKYGVPWKRGLIFHGPPGNGKTISLKALMHTLYDRKDPIPTLYVKSAPATFSILAVFAQARKMTPCLLVMEDIETIVTQQTRSYFFNEVDGLANNDGILMVASTNYLERLDPGLAQRPSRFDRKYLFPLPNKTERTLYAAFWRHKLSISSPSIDFPETLCPAIADLTADFSFAYMQEAFIATLLALARDAQDHPGGEGHAGLREEFEVLGRRGRSEDEGDAKGKDDGGDGDAEFEKYKLYRYMKEQVKILRREMGSATDDVDLGLASSSIPSLSPPPPPPPQQPLPVTHDHPISIISNTMMPPPPPLSQPLSPSYPPATLDYTTPNLRTQAEMHLQTQQSTTPSHFLSFDPRATRAREADTRQMALHGVAKRRVLTGTAFEFR